MQSAFFNITQFGANLIFAVNEFQEHVTGHE
jgi:hypothetical protein